MAKAPTSNGHGTGDRLRDLEAMLDAITDYEIIKLDVDGNVVSWSRGAEALTGFSFEEVAGRPVSIFYTDEDRAAGLVDTELHIARESGRFELEGWRVRKGGGRFWASVVIAPIWDEAGSLTGFVKVARDVTERKRAESMFRDLLEHAPDATVIVDGRGCILLVNRQVEDVFGYRRDTLIGQDVEILVPERFRARHPGLRRSFYADPQVRPMGVGLQLYGRRRDGSEFPVEISLSPIETTEGILVSAAIRDVTTRLQVEEELGAARANQEVLAERDRIARDLHDLVIQRLFASGIALQGTLNLSPGDAIAAKLERVVDDLDATIVQIRSTIFNLSQGPHEASGLRAQVLRVASDAAQALGFQPRVHFEGPIETAVPATVADHIVAVAREALSNAVRHAGASVVEVVVRAGDDVVLEVTDDGRGLGAVGRRSGLANMAERADSLGGTFTVTNRDGGGTRVVWRVPSHFAAADDTER